MKSLDDTSFEKFTRKKSKSSDDRAASKKDRTSQRKQKQRVRDSYN